MPRISSNLHSGAAVSTEHHGLSILPQRKSTDDGADAQHQPGEVADGEHRRRGRGEDIRRLYQRLAPGWRCRAADSIDQPDQRDDDLNFLNAGVNLYLLTTRPKAPNVQLFRSRRVGRMGRTGG